MPSFTKIASKRETKVVLVNRLLNPRLRNELAKNYGFIVFEKNEKIN